MIKWYKNLIIDETIKDKEAMVLCKLINKEFQWQIYCVAIASNEKNLFDIIPANEFKFPHYDKITTKVIGVCKGKEAAVFMIKKLIEKAYKETGGYNIKALYIDEDFTEELIR